VGEPVGTITEVRITECTEGTVVPSGVPVALTFMGLLGTSPEGLTGLEVQVAALSRLWTNARTDRRCLFSGHIRLLIALTHTSGSSYTTGLVSIVEGESELASISERLNTSRRRCSRFWDLAGDFSLRQN
jgi:hypothetical protein